MNGPSSYDVLLRPTPDARFRPGRLFLGDEAFLLAPSRHGRLARFAYGAVAGLFSNLPESLGLYDPHAVSRAEATHDPETRRIRYANLDALAPFVRPTGFSLALRVTDSDSEIHLRFRSNDERTEAVELARALRRRARSAGVDVSVFDPGGRTRVLSLDAETDG
ncbi:hypothetical protein AUR64_06240 [Haloprofundus marisrubri]|uniref:Uncharacterized protein n=1 Tax=Haloprofundus marisrubri TaxID=1514971 RepID=A0A0W1RB71_9EURY|nr:hypothetical protein [Haloprofundus marisrubri]KTG10787.1 hypothetical protein AUR64_06240 [Haloprofundus marisrubri]